MIPLRCGTSDVRKNGVSDLWVPGFVLAFECLSCPFLIDHATHTLTFSKPSSPNGLYRRQKRIWLKFNWRSTENWPSTLVGDSCLPCFNTSQPSIRPAQQLHQFYFQCSFYGATWAAFTPHEHHPSLVHCCSFLGPLSIKAWPCRPQTTRSCLTTKRSKVNSYDIWGLSAFTFHVLPVCA